ncbi:tetratricopeptide repeat protein [Pseudomonas sp. 5P_3.1_Bac2]|uniref:O-linked N-acetylglucosamine transferase, SPINDLY family protein n=1 Tax=Pseudomonas sp. 5P_3.1_Bac2 TaxID=2971617 RepID=UPI0021C78723|nr:tetratricopeptide repeat protein [Pseudomonas sp. 5P_3.1_Bac2]MCU1716480.1 tetratricopeptide repeat protein [Pseudomonas sp. 5P_3.1_Bac2]
MAKHTTQPQPAPVDFAQATLQAWNGELGLLQLFDLCNQLSAQQQAPLAAVLYQTWLKRNRTTHDHLALFNLGVILFSEGDYAGAGEVYNHALRLDPNFLQPRFNLGLVHERLGQHDIATAQWQWLETHARADDAEQRPFLLMALNNLGRHYEEQNRFADALNALTKSLQLEPNQPDVIHHWVFLRAKQCLWPVYEPLPGLPEAMQREYTSALAMISISEDPQEQLAAAQQYVRNKLSTPAHKLAPDKPYKHKKLRIAYCSSDFCLHPVAKLTVELFELHNREQFEVYGFDWSHEDGSALRQRVIKAMDHFERIHHLSDEAAAQLIRAHEIDILIDLQGQTLGARPYILALRPAPVQLTYLGLPATTGLPSIDYVIADKFLIPEDQTQFYSEKPLYLPDVYQASDRQRQASAPPSRSSCNLPEDAVVFCSFNNNYKFTEQMFHCWMRILQRTPNSVLWLLSDNPWAQANLIAQAQGFGIDMARLIFAQRVSPEDYLARFAVADLFLDTYPFNAGTTANDALWMGLPVLTRSGQTFASRMAGALLTAAELPELITYDLASYEEQAVALAHSPSTLQELRTRLQAVRAEGVLFDTPRLVRNLEEQLKHLVRPH